MNQKNNPRRRIFGVAAIAAALTMAVVVAPSFGAPSFLTKQAAGKVFLTQKAARGVYLSQKAARSTYATNKVVKKDYLTKDQAGDTYVRQDKAPDETVVQVNTRTVPFGPVASTTPLDVSGSFTSFNMPKPGFVVLTLSGTSLCKATTNGTPCPVSLLIDGAQTGFGKANFDLSSSTTPAPKASVKTLVSTTAVNAGPHVASIQYAGSSDASVQWSLNNFNLTVQGYPGSTD